MSTGSHALTMKAVAKGGLYAMAIKAEALGGRITGAGVGDFLLFCVEHEKQPAVRKACSGTVPVTSEPVTAARGSCIEIRGICPEEMTWRALSAGNAGMAWSIASRRLSPGRQTCVSGAC